ncbi:MAG: hypothetical protein LBS09_01420 [Bacteroidales bacterium]|jgi:hypothetical protein|nr:hypothetical protein [Bacteroidales bacterium]
MDQLIVIKKITIAAMVGLLLVGAVAQASVTNYYVGFSAQGTGNGGSFANRANLAAARTFVNTPKSVDTLRIIFEGSPVNTYTMPDNNGWQFHSSAKVVIFVPYNDMPVVFFGNNANIRFVQMSVARTAAKPLAVNITGITIRDFQKDIEATDGTSSLFDLRGTHSTLTLNDVTIINIASRYHPLALLGSNTTFNVKKSVISNLTKSPHGAYAMVNLNNVESRINIENSVLADWNNKNISVSGCMFYLNNASAALSITDSELYNSSARSYFFQIYNGNVWVNNSKIHDNTVTGGFDEAAFFYPGSGGGRLTVDSSIFSGNTVSTTSGRAYFVRNYYGTLTINGSVCRNNTVQSITSSYASFIQVYHADTYIIGSTFSNNNLKGLGITTHMVYGWIYGNILIVNNTFSGNTGMNKAVQLDNSGTGAVISNTFYQSGSVNIADPDVQTRNNLMFGDGSGITIPLNSSGKTSRNIFQNSFHLAGVSLPVVLPKETSYYMEDTLTCGPAGTPCYHDIRTVPDSIPVLRNGGSAAATGFPTYIAADQRGITRPAEISIGSVDRVYEHSVRNNHLVITYEPNTGIMPTEYRVNITNDFRLNGVTPDYSNIDELWALYKETEQPAPVGTARLERDANDSIWAVFTPATQSVEGILLPKVGTVGIPADFVYSVTVNGQEKQGRVTFTIINVDIPSGIMDEYILRCFTHMKPLTSFQMSEKFYSREVPGNGVDFAGNSYDGFSIPLIGDLNGDGKPEIVVLGINGESPIYNVATHICILEGATGKEVVRYPLPSKWRIRNPTHNSPSLMALVKTDRHSPYAEIIIATGFTNDTGADDGYRKRIMSFKANFDTMLPTSVLPKDSPSRLTLKYVSTERYDDGTDYHSGVEIYPKTAPLPQIVDINQDGKPEVVVYNSIFDAATGKRIMQLEQLQPMTVVNTGFNNRLQKVADYRNWAYTGRNRHTRIWNDAITGDREINFPFVYDLDGDGNMEFVAGGKVYYDININNGTYKVKSADHTTSDYTSLNIGEGYTGVADINSDGIPDIVVVSHDEDYPDNSTELTGGVVYLRIRVWNPGLAHIVNGKLTSVLDKHSTPPVLLAEIKGLPAYIPYRMGSHSYVYIGDIDMKKDAFGKKHPEISILGPRFYATGITGTATIPMHPNTGMSVSYKHTYTGTTANQPTTADGALMSWTWDETATSVSQRLKVSFMLEHSDRSLNTGFTMFDFDNDGIQEIVYRDEKTLRIISAIQPVIKLNATGTAIRLSQPVGSWTGFEYPVVADIDCDGSADIVVMGFKVPGLIDESRGFVLAFSSASDEQKFAPAPAVWNQFMYSPLKINENLTTPLKNLHPLSFSYKIQNHGPDKELLFNNTITQIVKSIEIGGELRPVVLVADLTVSNVKIDTVHNELRFSVKNTGNGTALKTTAIRIYNSRLGTNANSYVPNGFVHAFTLDDGLRSNGEKGGDLFPKETMSFVLPISNADYLSNFTIRAADETVNNTDDLFATENRWIDCVWADNVAEIGTFVSRNDIFTAVQRHTYLLDFLANDSLPENCRSSLQLQASMFTTPDGQGVMSGTFGKFEIEGDRLRYTVPQKYAPGIVEVEYDITCGNTNRNAKIFIYVVESCHGDFIAQKGIPYTVCLNKNPSNSANFDYFTDNNPSTYPIIPAPPVIINPLLNTDLWVKPSVPGIYKNVVFPRAKITVSILKTGKVFLIPNME